MPPSHSINFRPTDVKEKKTAILAVISFNDANSVPFSRTKVSEYFGIHERTVRAWCAAAAASTSASGSTLASGPAQQPNNAVKQQPSRSIKRARSEDEMAELLSASIKSDPHKTQNAARNGAQSQKKRKVEDEVSSASPPLPPQLLTLPRGKTVQSRKRRHTESTGPSVDFGRENSDE
jgi:hypothetical protein